MKFVHTFSNYLFKSPENVACSGGNGNNNDVTNMKGITDTVNMPSICNVSKQITLTSLNDNSSLMC